MSDHTHGEMNADVQEKTFDTFLMIVTRSSIAIIIALILLALING